MIRITHASAAGKPVDLTKPRRTASGALRSGRAPEIEMKAAKVAEAMAEAGVVGPQGDQPLTDEEQLEQYVMLENIGAPQDAMCKILGVSPKRLATLRFQAREMYVESLTSDGVLGTIGVAFHRIEQASKKIMAQLATLDDNNTRVPDLAKALVDFESKKVDLLVRTGAVKIKRKVEVSANFSQGAIGDPSLFSGDQAMRVLQLIAMEVSDVVDVESEAAERT